MSILVVLDTERRRVILDSPSRKGCSDAKQRLISDHAPFVVGHHDMVAAGRCNLWQI